jgi:hypothetical protein
MDLKSLEALGITADELVNRIVDKATEELMTSVSYNYDTDEEFRTHSSIAKQLDKKIKEHIDAKVTELADKHILPRVTEMVENITIAKTNTWGERTGEQYTFIEYLTKCAENYMTAEVNFEGKTKDQMSGYSFTKSGTRVAVMIDKHLHYSIETAMKNALAQANSTIATGLEGAVKIALQNATEKLKVAVTTK